MFGLLSVGFLAATLFSLEVAAATLYQNDFEEGADLADWSFYGADTSEWQIGTRSLTIDYTTTDYKGLENLGGWGAEKYAVLDTPLNIADVQLKASFTSIGNNQGYLAFETRKDAPADTWNSGVTFQIHRYHMLVLDEGSVVSSNLFHNVGNPRFDGLDRRGILHFEGFVRGNYFETAIRYQSDQGHDYYLANQNGDTVFSGSIANALDPGNIAIRYKTYTDSPVVYNYQVLDAPAIPEPSTLAVFLIGWVLTYCLKIR